MQPYSHETFARCATAASAASGVPIKLTGSHCFAGNLHAARFELQNGLTVLLCPNFRAPIFAYQTWFKVGSKHEDPARTGLAHLFEHLMFKGTAKHPTGSFDREMELRGAQTNAATWVDWTYYTQALAARGDNLETVVDFEADRMVNLQIDEQTFRSELEVVKNERRMSVEDSVVGSMGEVLMAQAYTQHSYRWPTIGSMAHLQAATVADLQQFYRMYYAPNNATVVLVGALDPLPTLTLLAQRYGPLARQQVHRPERSAEPVQQAERRVDLQRQVMAPQLLVGYHAPSQADPAYAASEVLEEILAAGDTARLYRRLVTDMELASEVSGSASPFAEPGLFEFYMAGRAGVQPDSLLLALQQELQAVGQGVSTDEMDKAKNSLELEQLESLKDIEGCAEALGHFETNYGDFGRAFELTAAYQQVTPQQVQQLAQTIFRPTNGTVVVATSEGAHAT
jgi:zinc protease